MLLERGVSQFHSLYFVFVLALVLLYLLLKIKNPKKISFLLLVYFFKVAMSSPMPFIMSAEEEVLTFKQGSGESFGDAWSRISESYVKTEPKMTLSVFLSSFYFGLLLCYRYALDAVVGGDFLHYDGDQAFNAIKKLIAASTSSNEKIESTFENMRTRLESLESELASFRETFKLLESVPIPFEPSGWVPSLKISINGTLESFMLISILDLNSV